MRSNANWRKVLTELIFQEGNPQITFVNGDIWKGNLEINKIEGCRGLSAGKYNKVSGEIIDNGGHDILYNAYNLAYYLNGTYTMGTGEVILYENQKVKHIIFADKTEETGDKWERNYNYEPNETLIKSQTYTDYHKEIIRQANEHKRKDEVSQIIHGKDETKFQKALIKVVIKYVSILQYGVEGRLSMAEEALVHATCRTEREAGKILGPFMGRAFFIMSEEKLKGIIKSIDDELKVIRKLRTPIEIEADELGL